MSSMESKGYILRGDNESQKFIMQANLRMVDLLRYAEFTYMTEPDDNPYDYAINQRDKENEFYQRRIEQTRIKEIVRYIKSAIFSSSDVQRIALFPTTILLAAHWDGEDLSVGQSIDVGRFYEGIKSLYIVDGQHRLFSLKSLYDDVCYSLSEEDLPIKRYLESYYLNCSILINFDLWEQARVFADVNFNQKPVKKSLYYSIFGMHVPEDSDDLTHTNIYIAHQLVRYVNTTKGSPLYRCIKMLGVGDGYVSQAFFADALIRHFQPRGIWYSNPDEKKSNYYYMAAETLDFFDVIKATLHEYWPRKGEPISSILLKTTGVGALIWLMGYIHKSKLSPDVQNAIPQNYDSVRSVYREIITKNINKLLPYAEKLFSMKGDFGGTGGKGQETELRKAIREIIDR